MKGVIVLLGAMVGGFISFVGFSLISTYQISRPSNTPEDSARLTDLFIFPAPIVMIAAGRLSRNRDKTYPPKPSIRNKTPDC